MRITRITAELTRFSRGGKPSGRAYLRFVNLLHSIPV